MELAHAGAGVIFPPTISPGGFGINLFIDKDVTDLPDPDSPTNPTDCPCSISNDRSSIIGRIEPPTGSATLRCFISRSATQLSSSSDIRLPIMEKAATVMMIRIPANIAWPYSPRAIDPVEPTIRPQSGLGD